MIIGFSTPSPNQKITRPCRLGHRRMLPAYTPTNIDSAQVFQVPARKRFVYNGQKLRPRTFRGDRGRIVAAPKWPRIPARVVSPWQSAGRTIIIRTNGALFWHETRTV